MTSAPKLTEHTVRLPLTTLHYVQCGSGPPLIMVPASISRLENWHALVQFMGQYFTVYFFELPGHGKSIPFQEGYSSERMVQTIEHFLVYKNHTHTALMGFSFGGILVLEIVNKLKDAIDKVIFLSPCVTYHALNMSPFSYIVTDFINRFFYIKNAQRGILSVMHHKRSVSLLLKLIKKLGHIEIERGLEEKLLTIPSETLQTLVYQITEILHFDINECAQQYTQPCFFAMSIYDPVLNFALTHEALRRHFPHLTTKRLTLPFHQPPQPFHFTELKKLYQQFLDQFTQI